MIDLILLHTVLVTVGIILFSALVIAPALYLIYGVPFERITPRSGRTKVNVTDNKPFPILRYIGCELIEFEILAIILLSLGTVAYYLPFF